MHVHSTRAMKIAHTANILDGVRGGGGKETRSLSIDKIPGIDNKKSNIDV